MKRPSRLNDYDDPTLYIGDSSVIDANVALGRALRFVFIVALLLTIP